jgi:uncharacterized protein
MFIPRIIHHLIALEDKNPSDSPMIFLSGPRQVGKTYFAKSLRLPYFNWDTAETKKQYLSDVYFFRTQPGWLIFDEVHKRRDWKKLLKGYFDSDTRNENFFITGSGRFQLYQKGGDSLQGRYDLFHLFPFILREVIGIKDSYQLKAPIWDIQVKNLPAYSKLERDLIRFSGFPEPYLKKNDRFLNKWMDLYVQRLVREDVRDLSNISNLDKLEMLIRLLPERTQSPISYQSLAEDLEVSPVTVKSWLRVLETTYLGFQIRPFTRKIHRAVKKEPKWYFFNWALNHDEAARFENYVAVQLLSLCTLWRDAGLGVYELWYLRDQDRREVDFLITKNLQPVALIEAKQTEKSWPSAIDYYARKLNIPSFVVVESEFFRQIANQKWVLSSNFLFQLLA